MILESRAFYSLVQECVLLEVQDSVHLIQTGVFKVPES